MKKHTYLAVLIVSLVVGLTVGGLRAQHTDPDPDCPSSCSGKTYLATCDNFISCHQGAKRTRRALIVSCSVTLAAATESCRRKDDAEARKDCLADAAAKYGACLAGAEVNYQFDKRNCCRNHVPRDCPDQVPPGGCPSRSAACG